MKTLLTRLAACSVIAVMTVGVLIPQTTRAATTLPDPVAKMFDAVTDISSITANSSVSVGVTVDDMPITFTAQANTVTNTKESTEVGFTFTLSSTASRFKSALGTSQLKAKGTIRVVSAKQTYIYFDDLPEIPQLGIDTSSFEKKWIELSSRDLGSYIETSGKKESFKDSIRRLKSAYELHPAFTFVEQGSTNSTYRYNVRLNPAYLASFIAATDADEISVTHISPSEFLDQVNNWNAYLVIDKATYLPKEIAAGFTASESYGSEPYNLSFDMVTKYTNFNKKVSIKKPSKSITLEKLVEDMTEEEDDSGSATVLKGTFNNMRASAEIYYDTDNSYKGFCKDASTKNQFSYLKDEGAKKTMCYDSDKGFAASIQMPDKTYLCVDSTGLMKTSKKKSISSRDLSCN